MKKAVIIYHLIIILVCLVFNTIAIYEQSAEIKFLFISEALLGIGLYYVLKVALDLKHYRGNLFLFIFNVLQVLALGLFGFVYKVSYGPQIFFNIYKEGDWFIDLDFSFYSRVFYINVTPPDGYFFLGLSILQLLFAIYFYNSLRKHYGSLFPKQTEVEIEIQKYNNMQNNSR